MVQLTFRADDHIPEVGKWLSFKEWRSEGFGVLKGEKARRYVHGIAVFHESQVDVIPTDGDFDPYDELWGLAFGLDDF